MNFLELRVELDSDLSLEHAALRDMMTNEEIFDYLEDCVRKAIHEKWIEMSEE